MKNKLTLIWSILLCVSCVWWDEKNSEADLELVLSILPRLQMNQDGYYTLPITSRNVPIAHRVYAYVGSRDYTSLEFQNFNQTKVSWFSNLYSIDGDTAGYYRKRRYVDDVWTYIRGDTLTTFTGDTTQFIPVITPNETISNDSGIVNTILQVPSIMFDDTLALEAATFDIYDECPTDSCFSIISVVFTQ